MEMNAPSPQLYTNEVSPEFLRTLDDSSLHMARKGVLMAEDFLPSIEA